MGKDICRASIILWLNTLPESAITIAYLSIPVMVTLLLRPRPGF